jgi:hypothetical protein
MRIPVSVEAAETCGGQRLIDGCVHRDPRVAASDPFRVARKHGGEMRIEQIRIRRSASMMHQARDGRDSQFIHPLESRVMPGPVRLVRMLRRHRFPKDGIAQCPDTEGGNRIKVPLPVLVPGLRSLVAETVADSRDGTFDPAP